MLMMSQFFRPQFRTFRSCVPAATILTSVTGCFVATATSTKDCNPLGGDTITVSGTFVD